MRRALLLALLGLLSFAGAALADVQPLPYALLSKPIRCPLANCSIASGGTAQTVLNANPGRKMFCLSNPSTATEPLFFDMGEDANTSSSLAIAPGALVCMGGGLIWQGTVSVDALSTSHTFGVEEFQ